MLKTAGFRDESDTVYLKKSWGRASAFSSRMWNCNLFDGDGFSVHGYHCKGDLLVKPAPSAAAGIQPEPAVDGLLQIFVGVTEYDCINTSPICRHLSFIVNQEKAAVLNLEGQCDRNMLRPFPVVVAAYHIDCHNLFKTINDLFFVP